MFNAFLLVVLIAAVLFRRDSRRAQDRRRMRSGRYGFAPMVGGVDHPLPPKGTGPVGRPDPRLIRGPNHAVCGHWECSLMGQACSWPNEAGWEQGR